MQEKYWSFFKLFSGKLHLSVQSYNNEILFNFFLSNLNCDSKQPLQTLINNFIQNMSKQSTKSLLSDDGTSVADHQHEESHIQAGQYIKSMVYGGLDGSINTMAIILGGIASQVQPATIMVLGLSVILGDGLGMGLGDYLSSKAEKQFIRAQEKRQIWQFENKFQDQRNQIIEIYTNKGYSFEQTNRLVDLFATNKQAFINIMMLQELGLVIDDSNPMKNGLITFISFAIFGLIPLIPYIIGHFLRNSETIQYQWYCIGILVVQLFSLGFVKAYIVGLNKLKSGLETLILGGIALGLGYGFGLLFSQTPE